MAESDFPGRLLHQACVWENAELLEDLLRSDEEVQNVNAKDKYGRTPLHAAAKSSNPSLVGVLLNCGANPNIQSSSRTGGETPLHIAAHHGRLEAVAGLLSSGAQTSLLNARGQTALDIAVEKKHWDCVEMLKIYQEAKAERIIKLQQEFVEAFQCGNMDHIVNILDNMKADANLVIDSALVDGQPPLLRAVTQNNLELVKLFLSKGANANICHSKGTALYEAAFRDNCDIAKALLEACPSIVSVPNNLGWLPLHVAVHLQHRQILDLLLNFPYPEEVKQPYMDATMLWSYRMAFDMNAVTADNQTPLYLAVETTNIRLVEQLLAKKVSAVNEKDELTTLSPVQINLPSYNGETALYTAVTMKLQAMTKLLLDHGSDPNLSLSLNNPPGRSSPLAAAVAAADLMLVTLLLDRKADDAEHYALGAVAVNGVDTEISSRIIFLHAHRDTEFKINKKLMELASAKGIRPTFAGGGSLTYNTIFPTIPVAINWQNTPNLSKIDENWLISSARALNSKVPSGMALYAITKLDVSGGLLEELPIAVFNLQSLRILNASHNRISRFNSLDLCRSVSACQCQVLQDLNFSHNQLTNAPDDLFYFPSLSNLDLSYNAISVLPFCIWQAPALKDLNLSHNLLQNLPFKLDRITNAPDRSTSRLDKYLSDTSFSESDSFVSSPEIVVQPVHRKNVWGSRLTTEAVKTVETKSDKTDSALKTINLSFNHFSVFPLGLPCLASNLSRLIMSNNNMHSMGVIQDYPSSLKHLDMSNNSLETSLRPASAEELHNVCFSEDSGCSKGRKLGSPTEITCVHRTHWRLDNLRTLIVANNNLLCFDIVGTPPSRKDRASSSSSGRLSGFSSSGSSLLYPNLSLLDVNSNKISEIPEALCNMTSMSVLNVENNPDITDIPPQLGLLPKMWTLNANGCNLTEPLKSMFENKQYKATDILGYLRSSLERCQPYTRMKLMLVGLENKGKTSLLKALRLEESARKSKQSESNWTQRMSGKSQRSSSSQLSTVGIDLGEWTCSNGTNEVTFRTWDFAGQREYYATHQYFLSKRAIYLAVWNMLDSYAGIRDVTQWLVNVQVRTFSLVQGDPSLIIFSSSVGTHLDEIKGGRFPPNHLESLKREVRERFMGVMDPDKHGLPRVAGCVEVSCKTKQNISQLCRMIIDTAWDIHSPGTNKLLMEQQVPAIYVALEDLVAALAHEYKESGQHPVVTTEYFRAIVAHELYERFNMTFRDSAELRQAVMFLHDNGILLHYEDSMGLKDLYFLDPQWLCDVLASVITVREVNPFVKKGIMKIDDLKLLFKPSKYALIDVHNYILSLLNKFEVALKLDTRNLLIPCLLPMKVEINDPRAEQVPLRIEIRSSGRNWIHFKPFLDSPEEQPVKIENLTKDQTLRIRRFYAMLYFPSGFWPRFISRLISDEKFHRDLRGYYLNETNSGLAVEWLCWQNALELQYAGNCVLKIVQMGPSSELPETVILFQANGWRELRFDNKAVLKISLPVYRKEDLIATSLPSATQILNRCVNHIDALLEDWYPALGTRFIHTSTGQYLVTKFVPCPKCASSWTTKIRDGSSGDSAADDCENPKASVSRAFSIEQVIYRAVTGYDDVVCPEHGELKIGNIAPETKFLDLPVEKLLFPGELRRGRILGRGAFGFVYRATMKGKVNRQTQDVAIKMLIPVDPGFGAESATVAAYKSVVQQWEHDPLQSYCKAYWTARQELSILTTLNHHNIVGLVGLSVQPLGIVLQLAPKGSLLDHIKTMRQTSERFPASVIQCICIQITKALEYLHGFKIIYRDLKSDNVLVWELGPKVLVKLTDYGISRAVTAASTTKGFAGTEAYIAPEIIQYGGEEEYNEGVDMFSFGMLLYELLNLRQPFEGQDQVKDIVLDGGRPAMAKWALQYPSPILDLLVVCWSQSSKDRPSSSQALSICNTPELGHLQDVAMLEDVGLGIVEGGIFALPDGVCIPMSDGNLNVISCAAHNWTESKMTSFPSSVAVTCCLVIPDFIWILRGKDVTVHCSRTLEFIETFSLVFGGPLQDGDVDSWAYLYERRKVLISLASQRLLLINCNAALRKNKLVEAFCRTSTRIYKIASVSKDVVWGACDGGRIASLRYRDDSVVEDYFFQHPEKDSAVADIIASSSECCAWTFLADDATLFCWTSFDKPQVTHKMHCDRLIPVSESLNSIGIDEAGKDENKRFISCICYFDSNVYVGTIWGSLIVVDGRTLNPLSIIRPHVDRVRGIVALPFPDGPRIVTVGQGYRDVISRFFNQDNIRQNVSPMTLCAIIWRTSDWALM